MGLQHQGHDAGGDGGGHAGAVHAEEAGGLGIVGVLLHQKGGVAGIVVVVVHEGDDVHAGRQDVGLGKAVQGGAGGGPGGQDVVAPVAGGALAVQGADGDDIGVVAGHGDGLGRGALVAGGGDDDDAGGPGRFHRPVERIDKVGGSGLGAQAEVEDADVELVLVLDHVLDALDDVLVGAGAVGAQDSHAEDVGLGGDAQPHAGPWSLIWLQMMPATWVPWP